MIQAPGESVTKKNVLMRPHQGVSLMGPQAQARGGSDDALIGDPFGRRHVQRLPEDEHHQGPEGRLVSILS